MKKNLIKLGIVLLVAIVTFYFLLPPLHVSSPMFWVYVLFLLGLYLCLISFTIDKKGDIFLSRNKPKKMLPTLWGVYFLVLLFPFLLLLIGSPLFHAKSYANRIVIENADFKKDIDAVDFSTLPLLDKDSSMKLGDRVMGQMPDLVSQFTVSKLYTQINYKDEIVRVTPLEYASVIKYFTNHKEGIKGYIVVNSVTGKANLVKLDKGMQYMPSAIFSKDLYRHLRFSYPTKILGSASFEIDDNGKPYWVVPTYKYTLIGLKKEVTGVVVLDPVTGESKFYKVKDVPTWVDHVYPADLIMEQVDNYGLYQSGFLNSLFGQKGVTMTTEGYNYTVQGDDVYLYTGITSVTNDESILGFIMSNLRTKETKFYRASGAKEESARLSAEGKVQQMSYTSTFPLLINLNEKPTYFLSLKDNAGLVKMYAFVDVEDYQNVVVTDASLGIEEAANNYLKDAPFISKNDEEITITIQEIKTAILDGLTFYYLIDTEENRYKVSIKMAPNTLPFLREGEEIKISYRMGDIREITKIHGN